MQLEHDDGANGTHTLTAVARDAAGNTHDVRRGHRDGQQRPDARRRSRVTAPAGGATRRRHRRPSRRRAADNVGVAGVQFKLDGANLGAEDTAAPYSVSWNTTTAANGSHTLTAVARDAAGNTTTSAAVTVTVDNDRRRRRSTITAPADGATVSAHGDASPPTRRDNVGVAGVQFKLDGANLGAEDTTAPYSRRLEHDARRQRRAHADRGRARRGRQHHDLRGGHRDRRKHRCRPGCCLRLQREYRDVGRGFVRARQQRNARERPDALFHVQVRARAAVRRRQRHGHSA